MNKNNSLSDQNRVFEAEFEVIKKQRELRTQDATNPRLAGLALSGGGIRSASFAIGVLQGLEHKNMLSRFDYMSTVSGGGYAGSAYTWFNYLKHKSKTSWEFPFGKIGKGARSDESDEESTPDSKKNPYEPLDSNKILDYLRLHGNYLSPGNGLTTLSLVAMIARSSLYSAVVYFSLLVTLLWVLIKSGAFKSAPFMATFSDFTFLEEINYLQVTGLLCISFSFVAIVISAAHSLTPRAKKRYGYFSRVLLQVTLGWLLLGTLVFFALGFLPDIHIVFKQDAGFGIGLLLTGIAGAIYQFVSQRSPGSKPGLSSGTRIWITALLLIYGLLYAAYWVAFRLIEPNVSVFGIPLIVWVAGVAIFGVFAINLNLFEINRMYRDRLMETFLPNPSAVNRNTWEKADIADVTMVKDMCGSGALNDASGARLSKIGTHGPYQLINTNLVLANSRKSKFRSRGGDNFVIAPAYCGGDALGWFRTKDVIDGKLTLATAMSISGAALNPNTGVGGKGVSRNKLVSFMMGFFNIRLGFWIKNPRREINSLGVTNDEDIVKKEKAIVTRARNAIRQPNLLHPGITQGLLGLGSHENADFIELSDGGHFDNTGLYELVRRRVSLIFLSQAGADPKFDLNDLSVAIERVKVDFGVIIRFDEEGFGMEGLIPGSIKEEGFSQRFELAHRGYAVARIEYPKSKGHNEENGYLVVIKSVLTDNLPIGLYHYKSANKTFPNQTTSDQFFDESQFEAYRELGYQLACSCVEPLSKKGII